MNRLQQALEKNGGGPILGAAAYMYNPTFLEIAALMGFQAAWIEMEHTLPTMAQAADLCRIASGLGMLTMIRIPDTRRAVRFDENWMKMGTTTGTFTGDSTK